MGLILMGRILTTSLEMNLQNTLQENKPYRSNQYAVLKKSEFSLHIDTSREYLKNTVSILLLDENLR